MRATRQAVDAGRRKNIEARRPVHTHGVDPSCEESVVDGQLVGACVARKAKRSTRTNRLARGAAFTGVTLTIPWKYLVPDNAKYGVMRGRMLLRAEYRQAKDTIQHIARRAMLEIQMAEGEVELHAKLYVPDRRRRDATNYAKLVQDSLQGAVYDDDTQIKRATWEHCGVDRENARCEVTISALNRRAA